MRFLRASKFQPAFFILSYSVRKSKPSSAPAYPRFWARVTAAHGWWPGPAARSRGAVSWCGPVAVGRDAWSPGLPARAAAPSPVAARHRGAWLGTMRLGGAPRWGAGLTGRRALRGPGAPAGGRGRTETPPAKLSACVTCHYTRYYTLEIRAAIFARVGRTPAHYPRHYAAVYPRPCPVVRSRCGRARCPHRAASPRGRA